jgi:hypothetical protein
MAESTEQTGNRLRTVAGAVAIAIVVVIISGLVYFRATHNGHANNPSVGVATVNGVSFSCRLPVLGGAAAGFISFPDGAVTVDHSVNFQNVKGAYGYTYDDQVRRWVPVPGASLSPDGRSYAYLAQTTGVPGQPEALSLHAHDVVSGSDRLLWQGSGSPMGTNAVTWLQSGIYFSAVLYPADGSLGPAFPALYVADPNKAGTPRRIGPNPEPQPPSPGQAYFGPDQFTFIGPGAAWGTGQRQPKEAPSPGNPPAPGAFGPDRVLRMDLRDGSVSTWYTVSGNSFVSVMGLDAQGQPILSVYQPTMFDKTAQPPAKFEPPPVTLLLLTGPNQTTEITAGNTSFHMGSQPSGDSHGIWFGSWDSIWLYTASGGLRQVATIPSGTFPSPSVPPGYPAKGAPASGARPSMPAYMYGTLLQIAGRCA